MSKIETLTAYALSLYGVATDNFNPGETCKDPSGCNSGICTENLCMGKKYGEECTLDGQCEVGLQCGKGWTIPAEGQ